MIAIVGAVLVTAASVSAALPTAAEVIEKITAKAKDIRTLEGDFQSSLLEAHENKFIAHFATMTKEEDGKVMRLDFVRGKMTIDAVTYEAKLVNDGVFIWSEQRDVENGIQVTKRKVRAEEKGDPYLELLKDMKSDNALFAYEVIGEETITGQKMYVMERHSDVIDNNKLTSKVTEKLWVGQDDLLIHRETRVVFDYDARYGAEFSAASSETTMEFTNLKVNQKVDPALFKYTPPDGVKVQEEK